MICENCGAKFDDELERCPYCGTMNAKGAFKSYRKKLFGIKDNLRKLDDEAYSSLQELIIKSLLKTFVILLICVAIGVVIGFMLPRTYSDADYEQRIYDEVVWLAENDAALSEALNNRDYATLEALREENYGAFYEWNHYDIYTLIGAEEEFDEAVTEALEDINSLDYNSFYIADGLCILYNPESIVNVNFDEEELAIYTDMVNNINEKFLSLGLDAEDTRRLYDECSYEYGVDSERLSEALSEVNHD